MDQVLAVLSALGGPAMGAALVMLVRALARRQGAAAAQEEALVRQLDELRKDVERERQARERLEVDVRDLREELDRECQQRRHYEGQYSILLRELESERRNAAALKAEMDGLRRAIM